jgi:hypothetical protein
MTTMDDARRPEAARLASERPRSPSPRSVPWKAPPAWNIPDLSPEDAGDPARPLATLVSFHYLRAAVRRRRLRCLAPAVLGLLLGGGFLVASPTLPMATTTLMLTHDDRVDASNAISTDISLLSTRVVAERTIIDLGLTESPQSLMNSVAPVTTGSSEILQVTMTGPTGGQAVRRLDMFSREYLSFRANQISAQSDILIKGYNDRIAELQGKVQTASARIQTLARIGDTATDRLSDAVTERSNLNDQISTLQAQAQDMSLRRNAIVLASRVIDPPVALPIGGLRRAVLVLVSGLIGGFALGFVLVVMQSILSDRLWLRIEVASALDTSVRLSARRITPLPRVFRFLPLAKALDDRRRVDRQRMAYLMEQVATESGRRQSVAVLCLGNSDDLRLALVEAVQTLRHQGRQATMVDLTASGGLASAAARFIGPVGGERPEVLRPDVVPSLAQGPTDLATAGWDHVALALARSGVTLVLADFDPSVGADHLTAWTDRVVVAVTAGRSSVQLVRTAGDLLRSTGLELEGAVLLRAVPDDLSSGLAGSSSGVPVPAVGRTTGTPADVRTSLTP